MSYRVPLLAALLLPTSLAACGSSPETEPPPADAAERGEITVHVTHAVGGGFTEALIHDHTGALIDRASIDTDGDATLTAGDGDTLTIARYTSSTYLGLDSICGIAAGDHYDVVIESGVPQSVAVTLPGGPSESYQYITGPGAGGVYIEPSTSTSVGVQTEDLGASGPVIILAKSASEFGDVYGWSGGIADPGTALTLPPYTAVARVTGNGFEAALVLGERITFLDPTFDNNGHLPVPSTLLGDALWLRAPAAAGSGVAVATRAIDEIPASWSWDGSERKTPVVGSVMSSATDVSWTASGATPDGFRVQSAIEGSEVIWNAAVAPDVHAIYLPEMPDDLPAVRFEVGRTAVAAYDHDAIDGWDAYRLSPEEWGPRLGEQSELTYDANDYLAHPVVMPADGTSAAPVWHLGPRW
jgi:hypothetical protein